ncbi:MAG: M23 family metallopeptidase [Actinomycetia bacterium]|nr:M23 family metallopeptidase [Actinomycetes bacterium]
MPPGATSGLFTTPAGGWPVRGPITSPYGWRNDPFTGVRSFHSGTDIGAPCGTPVVTTIAGTVAVVATDPARGNYIVIDHGSGLRTLYAHLSRQLTVVGRHVGSGQVIGLVGTTGRSTGCHLHFEAAQNGATFDSRRLLP